MHDSTKNQGESPNMGRPSLPEETARSQRVVTLLTKAERAELIVQAQQRSLSLSAYCHRLITTGLRQNKRNTEKKS